MKLVDAVDVVTRGGFLKPRSIEVVVVVAVVSSAFQASKARSARGEARRTRGGGAKARERGIAAVSRCAEHVRNCHFCWLGQSEKCRSLIYLL